MRTGPRRSVTSFEVNGNGGALDWRVGQKSHRPPPRSRAVCVDRARGGGRPAQRQRPDRSAAARGSGAARGEREAARTAETRPAAQGESMMLHLFLDERPWFSAKRHGYGTGLPLAWQGWVLDQEIVV